ncbi:hypothetical protein PHJA_001952700 [Phtheirospermum japonicum]|uniref:Integral membrane bound transporter domain-containing protein n=1 Tax=Phtheirospermum japonicum TaxID=374723 RepID=A0A830CFT0_9LAMI|nr:hypothetical protein PHJA_001952700 [Phtheirospermum japonicum]
MSPQIQSDGCARSMWRRCLASAFRTALACAIVGVATLYGPQAFNRQVAFPAFSYVTVILISTDATLGDTLRGCWLALYATVQGVVPAILSLWLIGPARLTAITTAIVVAVSAFVVALPENTHLISKRIALGQIVIVYVMAFVNGEQTETVMHPIHVAASTAVGVVASVLALLLPYPSFACWEVRENCKHYNENASERLKLYVKAFTAEDKTYPKALISQAKSLNKPANKFLQSIKSKQESMQWEIIPVKFFKSYNQNPSEKLQNLETILRGMEKALDNCSDFPAGLLHPELKNNIITFENQILENSILSESDTEMENKKFLQTLQTDTRITLKYLPSLFFIFCLKLLIQTKSSAKQALNQDSPKKSVLSKIWQNSVITIDKKRLMPAFKCALSLGFAVLFGSIYSKENAIWAGLPVAISLASAREATFKVANIKAQGTVLGTVYGVIGCFVFEKYVKIRFISLLPWFIFSSFLRQSKMYGQAGGVSAVIGAVLILGRKNFGAPSDFAIARIVETFIGLSCSIMVDILLQPTRASVLAKIQLSKTLHALRECVGSITITGSSSGKLVSLEENLNTLKYNLNELRKFIEEADVEPDFWFLPFHSGCYSKLRVSFSRMVDFLIFGGHAIRLLEKESEKMESKIWKEAVVKLESDLKVSRDAVCTGIKCFEEVSLVKSLAVLEREYEKRKSDVDLEMGKSGKVCVNQRSGFFDDDEMKMMKESEISFLEKLGGIVGGVSREEGKNEVILSLSSMVFCMDGLLRESKEIEKGIKEILQWENPSVQVDLHGIVSKLHAL